MAPEGARRAEILETAAALFASAGLRTTLKEIADACGVHPGSLYHHFDSKETIILELVRAYVNDLDTIADAALRSTGTSQDVETRIVEFGRAIASCSVRHRAALLLTLYDPPSVLGSELTDLAAQAPVAIENSMLKLLRMGKSKGVVRSGLPLPLLSDRLCQGMLHVGVGVSHLNPGAQDVPDLRIRILLHGLAAKAPSNGALDRSAALRAVEAVVAGWGEESEDDDPSSHLRTVARKEFGSRGYEATTMRDIAAAAKLNPGTVYRQFASKDELLFSVMHSYTEKVDDVWNAALRTPSSPLERLDALLCANIHIVNQFRDEFRIQLAWLRQSPPSTPADLGASFMGQLRQIKNLLAQGRKSGEIVFDGSNADLRARGVYEAVTTPQSIIQAAGVRGAHELARDIVLRGALTRG
jgi:AcrR family transcriptional regulator